MSDKKPSENNNGENSAKDGLSPKEPLHREADIAKHKDKANKLNEEASEHGGQDGPDPTRYGDWEKGGRCTDF